MKEPSKVFRFRMKRFNVVGRFAYSLIELTVINECNKTIITANNLTT